MRPVIAAIVLGACIALPGAAQSAEGQPIRPVPTQAASLLTLVDGGCGGPQFFRDRFGYCRPKGPPPRYYGCRPGFHPTPYGCRPNY